MGALILGGFIGAAVARGLNVPVWLGAVVGAAGMLALRLATSSTFNP